MTTLIRSNAGCVIGDLSIVQRSQKPLTKFWMTLNEIQLRPISLDEWRRRLGNEFNIIRPLLQLGTELAEEIPSRDPHYPHDGLHVYQRRDGKYVGIHPVTLAEYPLTRDDLLLYDLDRQQFASVLHRALGLDGSPPLNLNSGRTWPLGRVSISGLLPFEMVVLFPCDGADLSRMLGEQRIQFGPQTVCLTPTDRHWDLSRPTIVSGSGSLLWSLAELIVFKPSGVLSAVRSASDHFGLSVSSAEHIHGSPLTERALDVLVAMLELEAVDSDRRQTMSDIERRSFGSQTGGNDIKAVVASLNRSGLVLTKEGRGGGCWLSAAGIARAKSISSLDQGNSRTVS